jgi:NADP-dependent 3-hydroxy acid dehydrogenase YdfG
MRTTDLKAKVAVITGASSGIGKAIASGLAAKGTTLCLCGRNIQTLKAVAEKVQKAAQDVHCYKVDLSLETDITELTKNILNDFEGVDILIHSAGVISLGELEKSPVEDFDWHYRINLRAPYSLTQLLLPTLKTRQGQVVFINSSAGLNSGMNLSQYAATKHAMKAVSDGLRAEVNPYGVRVISVYPGRTATPMQERVYKLERRTYEPKRLLQPEDVAAVVIQALNLPSTAEVTDISIRPMTKP